jgi:hypothetical protein
MLFPRGKGPELFDFSLFGGCGGKVKCGSSPFSGLRVPNLMFPGLQPSRRELTPVRLCSVRLSWRQRARPSTTLHEIQICRSRLEYLVCNTGAAGSQVVTRKLYRPGARGWVYWTGNCSGYLVWERTSMTKYLKFAASFWMSAFLIAGSFGGAQTTSSAKAKNKSGTTTTTSTPATSSSSQTTTTQPTTTVAPTTQAVAHDVQSGTTTQTSTTPPKTMVGPDKRTILVPQI